MFKNFPDHTAVDNIINNYSYWSQKSIDKCQEYNTIPICKKMLDYIYNSDLVCDGNVIKTYPKIPLLRKLRDLIL